MKTGAILGIFMFLFTAFALSLPDMAEAARMGGGRSFGSRPSMSQPARTPTANRNAAQNPAAQAASPRTGMFGGMAGGLLGGLLAGTLLGSLLGGHGFQGGGFMDLILLAILAFAGYKLFKYFRNNRQASAASPGAASPGATMTGSPFGAANTMARDNSASSGWDALKNLAGAPAQADPQVDIPADFDTQEFLKGARAAYTRLQQSWDKRDLNDIAQFATPAVMQELKAQAASDPNPGKTEILLVNADVVGVEDNGDDRVAQVYFDVLMREDPNQQTPNNAREIWHFLRQGKNGSWKLDGIQQVQ